MPRVSSRSLWAIGKAVQRPECVAARLSRIGSARAIERSFRQEGHDGIDLRVDALDPLQMGDHDLHCGEFSRTDPCGELGRREVAEFIGGHA